MSSWIGIELFKSRSMIRVQQLFNTFDTLKRLFFSVDLLIFRFFYICLFFIWKIPGKLSENLLKRLHFRYKWNQKYQQNPETPSNTHTVYKTAVQMTFQLTLAPKLWNVTANVVVEMHTHWDLIWRLCVNFIWFFFSFIRIWFFVTKKNHNMNNYVWKKMFVIEARKKS